MRAIVVATLLASMGVAAAGSAGAPFARTEDRGACTRHDALRRPFFGDLHVHTTYSFDAWAQGTRNTPRDAYRFARGEAVGIQPYQPDGTPTRHVRLRRPLDFAMVSDHAEMIGETELCRTPGSPGYDRFVCVLLRRWPALGYMVVNSQWSAAADRRTDLCGDDGAICRHAAHSPWTATRDAAEEFYDRSRQCTFTTFVGFEWSGSRAGMIHRNVIFRNATVPDELPNAIDDGNDEGRLWERLERDCLDAGTGCDTLAIPHNSNWSLGSMFDAAGLTPAIAERRRRLEPLLEVTQHKGDSECRADGNDPLCAFETPDFGDLAGHGGRILRGPVPPLVYAREGLVEGLRQEKRLGVNPFKLGLIGSTDTHLGTPGLVDEDQFVGHAAGIVTARLEIPPLPDHPVFNPGGLAVLWAEENSRDALFAAMRRREAYGTSGPRMVVRFFGGWGFENDVCESGDFAAAGYAAGVPMGADLPGAPTANATPTFAVRALRDPGTSDAPGTLLERIQIVKGWIENGEHRERVFDVAGQQGTGSVDLDTCTPHGSGADDLCTVWRDPDFDPATSAFYYARVLENPTCRWSQRACLAANVDCDAFVRPRGLLAACCDAAVPQTIQERAWTSPIWYAPG